MSRRGFTLVELLVVVGIIAFLAAMAMPLLNMATRQAKRSNSEATLRKVDQALRMFRRDVDALPYQLAYPDAVTATTPFANNLGLRLGQALPTADLQSLQGLVAVGGGAYAYPVDVLASANVVEVGLPSALTFRSSYLPNSYWTQYGTDKNPRRYCQMLNRMAQRRVKDAVMAGAFDLAGGLIRNDDNTVFRNLSANQVFTSAVVNGAIGWCDDYLSGEVGPAGLSADRAVVLDAWGNPLVYVCQVVPAARSVSLRGSQNAGGFRNQEFRINDPRDFGLGTQGFAVGTGPWQSLVDAPKVRLLGCGRLTLSVSDAGDGSAVVAHATFLPDAANLRRSDRRYYAAPGMAKDYELWSAGPDGGLAWMRDDVINRDNVPATDYDRGLP